MARAPFRTGPRAVPQWQADKKSLQWSPRGGWIADPYLKPDEIAARREARVYERKVHEDYWLAIEQAKYRLPKRGRRLSGMAA